ncbi:MAG: endolytic transglycosylase MltG [Candidatus Saccharibacteria bacterium]|nr:endolytic transglycosylase MltG [Candidatus Saccharibacteria bacterium]
MKLLCLDVGTVRIGVAKADTTTRIAVPETTITVDRSEWDELRKLTRKYQTKWFVIGMPRNNRGQETRQSGYVKEFARVLKREIPGAKVKFQDETLTSVLAEDRLRARRRAYRKEDIDKEAAAIILQDFMEGFSTPTVDANVSDEPNIDFGDRMDDEDFERRSRRVKKTSSTRSSRSARITDEEDDYPEYSGRPERGKRHGKNGGKAKFMIIPVVILVVALGVVLGAVGWYNAALEAVIPGVNCSGNSSEEACKPVAFSVVSGETTEQIANNLEAAGLIRSALVFNLNMKFNHANAESDNTLKEGEYELTKTLTVEEVTKRLIAGAGSNVFSFMIYPGETVKSIKSRLISEQGYSEAEVTAAFSKTDYGYPILQSQDFETITAQGGEVLEGLIFGNTYEFYRGESVENIVRTALDAMQKTVEENNLEERYASRGLTLAQGITLASIVQKEAKSADQPMVAGVFYNRLAKSMSLGSDVTAQYAADIIDPNRATYGSNEAIVEIDSLYNTRVYAGLPPGAICNPGITALLAVAEPGETDAIYFLTGDDGLMYYSSTDEGHTRNIHEHCAELCSIAL